MVLQGFDEILWDFTEFDGDFSHAKIIGIPFVFGHSFYSFDRYVTM